MCQVGGCRGGLNVHGWDVSASHFVYVVDVFSFVKICTKQIKIYLV